MWRKRNGSFVSTFFSRRWFRWRFIFIKFGKAWRRHFWICSCKKKKVNDRSLRVSRRGQRYRNKTKSFSWKKERNVVPLLEVRDFSSSFSGAQKILHVEGVLPQIDFSKGGMKHRVGLYVFARTSCANFY